MDLGLKDRVAIVAASSRGLGRACALELAREGAKVVIGARDAVARGETAGERAAATGGEVWPLAVDLSSSMRLSRHRRSFHVFEEPSMRTERETDDSCCWDRCRRLSWRTCRNHSPADWAWCA